MNSTIRLTRISWGLLMNSFCEGSGKSSTRPAISQVTCGLAQRKAYRRNCVMAGTYAVVSSNRTTRQHGPS